MYTLFLIFIIPKVIIISHPWHSKEYWEFFQCQIHKYYFIAKILWNNFTKINSTKPPTLFYWFLPVLAPWNLSAYITLEKAWLNQLICLWLPYALVLTSLIWICFPRHFLLKQGPSTWSHHQVPSRLHISRKMNWKQISWDSDQHSDTGCRRCKRWVNTQRHNIGPNRFLICCYSKVYVNSYNTLLNWT